MSQPEQPTTAASAHGMPYESALLEVAKGLHRDPILLFGIGAGILLVALLAVTTSLAVVLVVAGFFVVVLAARAHQQARRVARGEDIKVSLFGTTVENSDVATAEGGGRSRIRARLGFSKVSGSRIGTAGGSPRQKSRED